MAQQDKGDGSGQRQHRPEHTPRLRLKRKAPIAGSVDGARWPHSDDLPAELGVFGRGGITGPEFKGLNDFDMKDMHPPASLLELRKQLESKT